ncbi:Triose-phosphate Transporter [Podila minutissima]|uniref:Triose-phosphate Transporter n=1 Tax=Podila minutissima TaxID=64525 RepID=A0A9P5VJ76_9FUNG|nr:Triose-phosphate Transporter [Podila minutissima]
MREARENTLARRLSQHVPKSSSSSPASNSNSSTPPQSPLNPSVSPDKSLKRISLIHPVSSISGPSSPQADRASSRKKNDDDTDDFSFFQRNILQTTATTTKTTTTSSSSSTQSAIFTLTPPPVSTAFSGTIASSVTFSTQHHQRTHTPPSSISTSSTSTRTSLGSVLASTFGPSGPGSPTSHQKPFKYPSTDTPLAVPVRKSTLSSESSSNSSKGGGFGNIAGGGVTAAAAAAGAAVGGIFKGNGNNSTNNGSNSVFINIGQTSSSFPQILMPKKKVAQNIAHNLSYIAAWYFFSTALSIYNKNLMGKDNWNFNLPLFVSSIHAGLHFVITACLMHFFPDKFDARQSGKGGRLTIHSYVTQVVPCAIAAALEICMANASLMYITLSFYTMIKSSTPIWVLVFAFFFRLEKPRMSLILIIGVIVTGVVLTVAGEAQFDMTGFILVLMASVMSGLRWSMTQMLLQKDTLGMDNPVATLYYISPIMFVIMSILSLVIEDPFVEFAQSEFFSSFHSGLTTLMMAAGGGLLAFAMTVAEFKLIKNTGTVTLSVAGISKEIVIISLSMLIFGDRLTFVNLLGLLVSIGGIMAYNYDKIRKLQHGASAGDYEILSQHSRHRKGDNTD